MGISLPLNLPPGVLDGQSSLLNSLVAYWTLNEQSDGSGAVTRNDSVGSNHLTDTNTTPSAAGKVGNGANCQAGNSEYLTRADTADLSFADESVTLSLWVKYTTTGTTRRLLGKGTGVVAASQYAYVVQHASNGATYWIVSDGTHTDSVNTAALNTSTWYHIVMYYDADNDELGIIVNDGTPVTKAFTYGLHDEAAAFYLGAGPGAVNPLDGILDEVGIWRRVLTASEITSLYNGGSGNAYPFA